MKTIIIGGVAAGASAAARLRRNDENMEIILIEKGEYISFANCGLPYYIGGVITDREELLVTTPEMLKTRFKIDVRTFSEAVDIDTENKNITIESTTKGTYIESYDYLVISPGAKPIPSGFEHVAKNKLFTLRNMNDTDNIKEYVDQHNVKEAIVIGGGYIGVEMAENLIERNIKVNLVQWDPHILAPFDDDIVVAAEEEMRNKGVNLFLKDKGIKMDETSDGLSLTLESGQVVNGDIVIAAIGVLPDTEFLKKTNIELGPRGHVITDKHMQTNVPNVYAGGDAVEVFDFINGQKTAIPLAGPANKQGRIIADNICDIPSEYSGTQGTTVIKVFDLALAATGNTERLLTLKNIPFKTLIIHPNNHAGYYPGATQITLKLIFNDEGKILGAQASGISGVEKRIDVIATAVRFGGTIYDLTKLELSYAPPFGSAKDPVNFAGYVAENALTNKSDLVHPRMLETIKDNDNIVVLDVRTSIERRLGHLKGSIHIPIDELRERMDELDIDKEYWIHCAVGVRAYIAERILKQNGFNCKNITGGFTTIEAMGLNK